MAILKEKADYDFVDESSSVCSTPLPPLENVKADYDFADESSSVCSTPLPPLENVKGVEPQTKARTIKSILKSCPTRKVKTSKEVIIDEINNFSTPTKGNKNVVSASKKHSTTAGKRKDVKTEADIPMSLVMKELQQLKLQAFASSAGEAISSEKT
nr:hypothetical protein [Tanacetum cinerariifolium]